MATNRQIVGVDFTRNGAEERASHYRGTKDQLVNEPNRHPRIHERQVSAEGVRVVAYVVVADALPRCEQANSKGGRCVKAAGHKGRCWANDNLFFGDGKPEAAMER